MKLPLLAALLAPPVLSAADYSISSFTIAGGSGTTTGGQYSLTGTIGQPDASVTSGGQFTLQGGFWGAVAAIQTPGAPLLSISLAQGAVTIAWPLPDTGWMLELTTDLAGTPIQWTPLLPPYMTDPSNIFITVPVLPGSHFYRLRK